MASCRLLCFSQIGSVFIDYDIRMLERLETSSSRASREYNDKLLDLSFQYADTCYHDYYAYFANAIIDNNDNLRKVYGIDNMEYRQAMIALNNYFLHGRYVDDNYSNYEERAVAVLLGLEKYLQQVSSNKEQFLAILSGVYKYHFNDTKKALAYSKKRLKIAEKDKLHDPTNYAYALSLYIQTLADGSRMKDANHEIAKLANYDGFTESDREFIVSMLMSVLDENTPDYIWLQIAPKYAENKNAFVNAIPSLCKLAENNRYNLMMQLDSIITPWYSPEERILLYRLWGSYIGNVGNNWEAAAYFNYRAIQFADSMGRADLHFWQNSNGSCSYSNDWGALSTNYRMIGDPVHEIWAQENAVKAIEEVLGKQSDEWLFAAKHLSALYSGWAGDYTKAIRLEKDLIQQAEIKYGSNDSRVKELYCHLVGDYRLAHSYDTAISTGDSVIAHCVLDSAELSQILNIQGLCYNEQSNWYMAYECYNKALEYAVVQSDRWTIQRNLAGLYGDMGLYSEQLALLHELETSIEKNGSSNDKFDIMEELGHAELDDRKAMTYYNKAEAWMGNNITTNRLILHYQGKAARCNGRYDKLMNLEKAITIFHETSQQDSVLLGILYRDKGDAYADAMDYLNADEEYAKALEYLCDLPFNDENLLTLLNNMAANFTSMTRFEEAARIHKAVLKVRSITLGRFHPKYLTSLSNLFISYLGMGDVSKADSIVTVSTYSADPSSKATMFFIFSMKARLALAKKQYGEALSFFVKAEEYCRNNADAQMIRTWKKEAYKGNGDTEKYIQSVIEEISDLKRKIAENYYTLTREERKRQSFYLSNIFNELMADVTLDKRIVEVAFDFSLFSKGLLLRTEKELNKIFKNDVEQYIRFLSLKEMYNQAVTSADSLKASNLQEQISWLEREMSNKFNAVSKLNKAILVGTDNVLRNLPKDALAINFVRYGKGDTFYYGAFCVSKQQKQPIFVELCNEEDILQLLKYDRNGDLLSSKLKSYFNNLGGTGLYKYVWKPIEEIVGNYKTVYFSGTYLFDAIPIEYLKDDSCIIVADKYEMHRVFSLTDIKGPCDIGNHVVAFGVADHNSPVDEQSISTRGKLANLPEVKTELEVIKSLMKDPISFELKMDDEANESRIKEYSGKNITALHIATHAFYLSPEMMDRATMDINDDNHYAAIRFLRSGKTDCSAIVLRKGNLTWHSPDIPEGEDDILTSDEVENLDFPSLNLVVLSACQTGKGQADMEGVWGLQRSFRIAGTKSLICTTRQVDSKYAEEFMAGLYDQLVKGETIYSAFTKTRQLLNERYKSAYSKLVSFILIE